MSTVTNKILSVGVVGGSGYTGVELIRLLARHPNVKLAAVTSRAEAGRCVSEIYPSLRGVCDVVFEVPDIQSLMACDVVFYATPNGTCMQQAPELLAAGVKVIDLAADFRLTDTAVWEQWYGMKHSCVDVLNQAVYGLPEMNRAAIQEANIVANPGCYPTAVQLGFLPLVRHGGLSSSELIADCKSGASGAGRSPAQHTLLCEAGENFHAYGASGHRHLPEIEQGLGRMTDSATQLTFVPHLLPMIRGIHATLYMHSELPLADIQTIYEQAYANEPYVDVMPVNSHPETRDVRGGNTCRIAIHKPAGGTRVIVLSVIDNLTKGAAGQAVQNMNLMSGFAEHLGLDIVPLAP